MEQQTTRSATAIEFTYDWYRSFLDRISAAGFDFRPFGTGIGDGEVVLRHDVDLSVTDALEMARIEADRGVQATYCILCSGALYNPLEGEHRERIAAIEALGHDVSLHFSTHEYWEEREEPEHQALADRIADEWAVLDTLVAEPTETVSFHRPPSWVLDRPLDRWHNTYAPAYFSEVTYLADSGQRWRSEPPTLEAVGEGAQILIHPGLWGEQDGTFEERVRKNVSGACRHVDRKAHREFLPQEGH